MPIHYTVASSAALVTDDLRYLWALDCFLVLDDALAAWFLDKSTKVITLRRQALRRSGYVQDGSRPGTTIITLEGLAALREFGFKSPSGSLEAPKRQSALENPHVVLTYPHTLAITAFLIAAHKLIAAHPQLELYDFLNDRQLRRLSSKVAHGGDHFYSAPDAWLDFRWVDSEGKQRWLPIVLELDRGNEHKRGDWIDKIEGLFKWRESPCTDQLAAVTASGKRVRPSPTFAVLVTMADQEQGRRRMERLREWTRVALDNLGKKDEAHLFCFLAGDAKAINPTDLFLAPIWSHPFDDNRYPLLEV